METQFLTMKVNPKMSETTEIKILNLDEIRIDGGTQPRIAIDEKTVAEYSDLLKRDTTFPPIVVFYDGSIYWLADGFHRYFANKQIKRDNLQAEIHKGTQRDAILYSVGANATHGMRRSNHDKHKAILTLLEDKQWAKWSDSEIAKRCGVSPTTVGAQRSILSKMESMNSSPKPTSRTFVHHKTGKPTSMRTGNIGRPRRKFNPTGEIARDAFSTRQPHSQCSPVPMRNVNLPLNNPQKAAQCMFSVYGEEYMRALCDELNTIFRKKGLSNVK